MGRKWTPKRAVVELSRGARFALQWDGRGATVVYDGHDADWIRFLDPFELLELSDALRHAAGDGDGDPDEAGNVERIAGVCRVCGCTEFTACENGCSWVEADLCSACLESSGTGQGGGE